MNYLIVAIVAVVVGFLIWRSKQSTAPAEQACAREIGDLLKSHPGADPQSVANLLVQHEIARSRCRSVGRMVMPHLRRNGLKPEDARIAMQQVRAAYPLVP